MEKTEGNSNNFNKIQYINSVNCRSNKGYGYAFSVLSLVPAFLLGSNWKSVKIQLDILFNKGSNQNIEPEPQTEESSIKKEEESNRLEPGETEEKEIEIKVFDNNSDISFNDAFAISREQFGAGGAFEWNGDVYNTYYKEEWDELSLENKNEYMASLYNSETEVKTDVPSEAINYDVVNNENYIDEKFVSQEFVEMENGDFAHIGVFNRNEEVVYKLDLNNDKTYDFEYTENAEGALKGINGFQDTTVDEILNPVGEKAIHIEITEIDGFSSIITTYENQNQTILTDIDGDGEFETLIEVNPQGEVIWVGDESVTLDPDGNYIGKVDENDDDFEEDLDNDMLDEDF